MPNEINHGVIEGVRDTDFVAGTIPYEVRNPSGDWSFGLPPGEWQSNSFTDTMACVTFGELNSIETQMKLVYGLDKNYSDRFTAFMSGTTPQGNYLWKVADSIRKDGLVEESVWPSPPNFTWDTYYTPPMIEVINKAKEWKAMWRVEYEFIPFTKESIMFHLKQSPINVIIPGHLVMEFINNEQVEKYFDSYAPFVKDRTQTLSSAMKIVLTRKNMLDKEDIRFLQALEGFRDEAGVNFWGDGTHTLKEYKSARVPDKINGLNNI